MQIADLFAVLFSGNPPPDPTGVGYALYSGTRVQVLWDVPTAPPNVVTRLYVDDVLTYTSPVGDGSYDSGVFFATASGQTWEIAHYVGGKESARVLVEW